MLYERGPRATAGQAGPPRRDGASIADQVGRSLVDVMATQENGRGRAGSLAVYRPHGHSRAQWGRRHLSYDSAAGPMSYETSCWARTELIRGGWRRQQRPPHTLTPTPAGPFRGSTAPADVVSPGSGPALPIRVPRVSPTSGTAHTSNITEAPLLEHIQTHIEQSSSSLAKPVRNFGRDADGPSRLSPA